MSEHERIIAFRNVLIHGYDLADDELVWDTIENKLPVLLAEVEALLKELGQHGDVALSTISPPPNWS